MEEKRDINTYIISYETEVESEADEIIMRIKKFPGWAKLMNGVWMVKTGHKAVTIRDELKKCAPINSKIFVMKANKGWAYKGLTVGNWIKKNI